jgi:hypothetical protein
MSITATYSPEDNKIRLYSSTRLDAETYARVKEAGFKWAPKQELFVAPKWTPAREDLAAELAGDIEPEEMTLAERAAMKAERLEALAAKRHGQAKSLAARADDLSQAFYMGQPILIGHHSERKARKTQERMHAAMTNANKAEKAANHWLYRANGVEWFANMKNCDRTRANRIKTLLAELRDLQRGINDAHKAIEYWQQFQTPERIIWAIEHLNGDTLGIPWGTYSKREEIADLVEFRAQCIANLQARIDGPNRRRWIDHILNRLAFERSMLGDVPRFAGELTPVILQAFAREHGADKPRAIATDPGFYQLESDVPLPLHIGNGADYLELSEDEWRDVMQACGYIVPEKREGPPPILNLDCYALRSMNKYNRDRGFDVYRVARVTREQYGKVNQDYRGTRLSHCGQFRFKIANEAYFNSEMRGRHSYVAVFLTDQKAHALPDSDSVEMAPELEAAA